VNDLACSMHDVVACAIGLRTQKEKYYSLREILHETQHFSQLKELESHFGLLYDAESPLNESDLCSTGKAVLKISTH
jgi:hypothetical protein